MKQVLKITMVVIVIGSVTFFAACNNSSGDKKADKGNEQHDSTAAKHDGYHSFACPMHPEVIGKEGDTCPKCGMKLSQNDIKDMKH